MNSHIICENCANYISNLVMESLKGQEKREHYYHNKNLRERWLRISKARYPHKSDEDLLQMLPTSIYDEIVAEINELSRILIELEFIKKVDISKLHFICLFIDDFNAFAIKGPNEHCLCIINSLIPETLNMLNSAIVDYVFKTEDSTSSAKNDVIIFCQSLTKLLGVSPKYDHVQIWENNFGGDRIKDVLVESLCATQLAFIVAHEIGHHYLGHLTSTYQRPLNLKSSINLTCYSRSQEQELEADQLAAKIFISYFSNYSKSNMFHSKFALVDEVFIGPILLMIYLECLENGLKGYLRHRTYEYDSHPPALLRRKQILSLLSPHFNGTHKMFLKGINSFLFECIPFFAKRGGSNIPEGSSVIDEQIEID